MILGFFGRAGYRHKNLNFLIKAKQIILYNTKDNNKNKKPQGNSKTNISGKIKKITKYDVDERVE